MKMKILAAAIASVISIATAQAAPIASTDANHSFSSAQVIPEGYFTTLRNDAIEFSTTLPNATVTAFSNGPFDYYRFTTASPGSIILDIDFTYAFSGNPGPFDPWIAIWKAGETNALIDQNDDRGTIDPGSQHEWDSYLHLQNMSEGTYIVGVAAFPSNAIDGGSFDDSSTTLPAGSYYTLHISAPVPEPEAYAMFLAGLGLMGAIARRRRGSSI